MIRAWQLIFSQTLTQNKAPSAAAHVLSLVDSIFRTPLLCDAFSSLSIKDKNPNPFNLNPQTRTPTLMTFMAILRCIK